MSLPAPVITVDGASGTGKGAVSQYVAHQLGWHLLDSGLFYRATALVSEQSAITLTDEDKIIAIACSLTLTVTPSAELNALPAVFVNGKNVTTLIRTEVVGNAASKIAALPQLRNVLLARQRAYRQMPGLVADGRDMGTCVFPDAQLKVFLTASPEQRAIRRYKQLKEKRIDVNLTRLIEALRERDQRDRERAIAPLKPAVDALCIDTDPLTIEQVALQILSAAAKVLTC